MDWMEWWEWLTDYIRYESYGRLLLAAVCGAVLGWEREWSRKPAGLRTYMLVAVGSATFTLVAVRFTEDPPETTANLDLDPTRVMQGIVGGIGFLGAGAIIQSGGSVRGLTTAAGVWLMGGVGVASGLGYYDIALATTLLAVFIIAGLGVIEKKTPPDDNQEQPAGG